MYRAIAARWSNGMPVEVSFVKGESGNVLAFAAATGSKDLIRDALVFADVVLEGLVLDAIEEEPDLLCLGVMYLPDEALVRTAQDEVKAKYRFAFCVVEPGQTVLTMSAGNLVSMSKPEEGTHT